MYQYLTNFKYNIPSNKKLYNFYFQIFGNLTIDLKVF